MQIDNAKDIVGVMNIYNLIEYSEDYSQTSEVYGYIIEINQLQITMIILLISLLMMISVFHLNIKKWKQWERKLWYKKYRNMSTTTISKEFFENI